MVPVAISFETLAEVRAEGGATVLAHPSRRNCFEKITSEMLGQLDAIEIWNRKADGLLPIRSYFDFARLHNLGATVSMRSSHLEADFSDVERSGFGLRSSGRSPDRYISSSEADCAGLYNRKAGDLVGFDWFTCTCDTFDG